MSDAPELSPRARAITRDAEDVYVSVASCWEMAIKASLGKLQLPAPVERFVAEHLPLNDFTLLPARSLPTHLRSAGTARGFEAR